MKRGLVAALAGLALAAPASAALAPTAWTIAETGPRGGATYAGSPIDDVGALYLPPRMQPGRRLRVAYLLGGPGAGASTARALGIAAAADELQWQRTTPPFAVAVTSAGGRRTLAAAMRFAQRMLSPVDVASGRAVIGFGRRAALAMRLALQPGLHIGTGIAIGGRIPAGLVRRAEHEVRARRLRMFRPAIRANAGEKQPWHHQLLESLAFAFAPAATSRASRAAEAIAPYGWVRIAAGPYGGTVWQGVIPNRADPGHPRASLVYLPPGVEPNVRLPALYLLHGLRGSPYSFVGSLRLAVVADTLIHAGRLHRFIAVMPPAGQTAQFDGEWTGPWERYVVRDVVPWAGRHLPLEAGGRGRTLAGYSAGGYGSVDMGLRHPGLFGTLESWSGYFRAPRDGSLANANASERADHDPQALLAANAAELRAGRVRFFVSAGRRERKVLLASRDFARELAAVRLEHVLHVTAGGHHGGTWRAVLPAGLRYAFAR